jgi:hypothetical protein
MKGKYSDDDVDSVGIILGKLGKPKAKSVDEDQGLTKLGKALRLAIEGGDDAAIGRALADAHEYCQPDPEVDDD